MAATAPQTDRFPLVDSVRALAAFVVIGAHARTVWEVPVLEPLVAYFNLAVTVFFAVSGLLLYRPFVAARIGPGRLPSLRRFVRRRLARIVPAFWLACVLLLVVLQHEQDPRRLLIFFGFAQTYFADTVREGIVQAWTLCVELAFYALLPLYAAAMLAVGGRTARSVLRREMVGLSALVLVCLVYKVWVLARIDGLDPSALTLVQSLPWHLVAFVGGMALAALSAVWAAEPGRRRAPVWLDHHPGVWWAAAAAALLALALAYPARASGPTDPQPVPTIVRNLAFVGVTVVLLVPTVFGPQQSGMLRRVLANPALLWTGRVSYGLYLYHYALLNRASKLGISGPLEFAVAIAAATAMAAASYYALERPLLRWANSPARR